MSSNNHKNGSFDLETLIKSIVAAGKRALRRRNSMCKGPLVSSVAGAEARGGGRPDPQGWASGEGLGPRSVGPKFRGGGSAGD